MAKKTDFQEALDTLPKDEDGTPTLFSLPEPEADEPEAPAAYTINDQIQANTKLVAQLAKEHGIEPSVVASVFNVTLNYHLAKIQLGLTQTVEA